jgi:hypothetical protein
MILECSKTLYINTDSVRAFTIISSTTNVPEKLKNRMNREVFIIVACTNDGGNYMLAGCEALSTAELILQNSVIVPLSKQQNYSKLYGYYAEWDTISQSWKEVETHC